MRNVKKEINDSLTLRLLEESYGTKVKFFYKKILFLFIISIIFSLFYSSQNNMYNVVKELFNSLSDIYSILIGFNISSVVFIVSFLFKENNTLSQYQNKSELNNYYQQIVNSFMLSTLINLIIIILGILHLTFINVIRLKVIDYLIKDDSILYFINVPYLSVWSFLILSSLIVFFRCLITLTRLLRITKV